MKTKLAQLSQLATNNARRLGAAASAVSLAVSTSAMAAVPAEVTTELASMKDDVITIGTVVLLAVVAIFAFKFMRKGL